MDKALANELVKRIGEGDDGAVDILYNEMHDLLATYLYSTLYDKDAVADAIQRTFLVVVQKSRGKMVYFNCFSWIYTIASNVAMNMNRSFRREHATDFSELCIFEDPKSCDVVEHTDLSRELSMLTPKEQIMINYRYVHQRTYREISQVVGMTESTVKRRLDELIMYLEERLKEESFQE